MYACLSHHTRKQGDLFDRDGFNSLQLAVLSIAGCTVSVQVCSAPCHIQGLDSCSMSQYSTVRSHSKHHIVLPLGSRVVHLGLRRRQVVTSSCSIGIITHHRHATRHHRCQHYRQLPLSLTTYLPPSPMICEIRAPFYIRFQARN